MGQWAGLDALLEVLGLKCIKRLRNAFIEAVTGLHAISFHIANIQYRFYHTCTAHADVHQSV